MMLANFLAFAERMSIYRRKKFTQDAETRVPMPRFGLASFPFTFYPVHAYSLCTPSQLPAFIVGC